MNHVHGHYCEHQHEAGKCTSINPQFNPNQTLALLMRLGILNDRLAEGLIEIYERLEIAEPRTPQVGDALKGLKPLILSLEEVDNLLRGEFENIVPPETLSALEQKLSEQETDTPKE